MDRLLSTSLAGYALAALLCPAIAFAQQAGTPPTPDLDPAAVSALQKMGQALRALDHFKLTSDASAELVLDTGQKISLENEVRYQVQKPDHLAVDITSDLRQRQLFYDGNELTVYAPQLKFYAVSQLEGKTLGDLVLGAARMYDVQFPLTDLFFWGTDYMPGDTLTSAMHVGGGTIDGESVDQYAFRQPGVDWQVWISKSTQLPKRLTITNLEDEARPQYTAQLNWDTKTVPDKSAFVFSPAAGVAKINLAPATSVAVQADKAQ